MFYQTIHIGTPDYFKKEYGTDFSFPPHMHRCFELITALSGEMFVTVDEREYRLLKGEALLIFPDQIHSLRSEHCRHMLCIFSPTLVSAYASKISAKKPSDGKFVPDRYLLDSLDALGDDVGTITKKGLLYLLCGQFDASAEYLERGGGSRYLLGSVFRFIERSYGEECTLTALSKELGYDYAYLSRYFKKNVGMTFNEYVNIYRLNNACYLLGNSEQTVLHCALESGYTSLRSFNRNFKARFGITPREYVKEVRG